MHKKSAIYLLLLGGTLMSFIGVCMRLIEPADGFQILFYRSISRGSCAGRIECVRRRVRLLSLVKSLDLYDWIIGLVLSLAFTTYMFAMLHTSVASTLFILTSTPFTATLIGWKWIDEKSHPITWLVMVSASFGVALMITEGVESNRSFGNFIAPLSRLSFALMLVFARRSGKMDVLGATFAGGVFAMLIWFVMALAFGKGLNIGQFDIGINLLWRHFSSDWGLRL